MEELIVSTTWQTGAAMTVEGDRVVVFGIGRSDQRLGTRYAFRPEQARQLAGTPETADVAEQQGGSPN